METHPAGRPLVDSGRRQELDSFFKALSHPTRRDILRLLGDRSCTVGEIVDRCKLSQPSISRHLSLLKQAELVVGQRQSQHVVYRLRSDALLRLAEQFFGAFRRRSQGPLPDPATLRAGRARMP